MMSHTRKKGPKGHVIGLTALLLFSVLLLISCPNPIEQSMIDHAKDTAQPTITIPVPPKTYSNSVTITGTVSDTVTPKGDTGEVNTFTYEIVGTGTTGTITIASDGSFTATIDTKGLNGEITVQLTAEDWNGNVGTYSLELKDDEAGPDVEFSSPENESYYAATVIVEGVAANDADTEDFDEVKSLSYEVLSSSLGEDLTYEDGTFGFSFSTSGLSDTIIVRVTAEDYNENVSQTDLTLLDGGSGIPTLTASSGNGQVTLSWDDAPYSESYVLYYTTNGSMPSASNGTEVEIGAYPSDGTYTVAGLANGSVHGFKLKSNSSEGDDNWSDLVKAIPLSPFTLAPTVEGGRTTIQLSWPEVTGWDDFIVYRSTTADGTFINLSGQIDETEFLDTGITAGTNYFYKVEPTMAGSSKSGAVWGQTRNSADAIAGSVGSLSVDDFSISNNPKQKLLLNGTTGYSMAGDMNFRVIDFSDPTDPEVVNEYDYSATEGINNLPYSDIALGDSYVFLMGAGGDNDYIGHEGIHIYDIDPFGLTDTITSSDDDGYNIFDDNIASGELKSIAVKGDYIYLFRGHWSGFSATDFNIDVIDVSYLDDAGTEPTYSGQDIISATGTITSGMITVEGNYLYCVYYDDASEQKLIVFDISNPGSPVVKGSCALGMTPLGIVVEGNYASVTGNSGGSGYLKVIDVSNPTAPAVTGSIQNDIFLSSDNFSVQNRYGYFYNSGTIYIVDMLDPEGPYFAGEYSASWMDTFAAADGYVYSTEFSSTGGTIQVTDLRNLPAPATVGSRSISSGTANDTCLSGNYAYLATGSAGLKAIDISNTAAPQETGSLSTTNALAVTTAADYCFLADGSGGLKIIDVSDPASPLLSGTYDTSGTASDISVAGDYAFVADSSSGLAVIDIADVTSPSLKTSVSTTDAQGLFVSGDYLYLADGTGGLTVFDIQKKDVPVEIGSVAVGTAYTIYPYNTETLFVGTNSGIAVVNIANPSVPSNEGTIAVAPTSAPAVYDITIAGDYGFTAGGSDGLSVIFLERRNVLGSTAVGRFKTGDGPMNGIDSFGDFIVAADGAGGLQIIDPWP